MRLPHAAPNLHLTRAQDTRISQARHAPALIRLLIILARQHIREMLEAGIVRQRDLFPLNHLISQALGLTPGKVSKPLQQNNLLPAGEKYSPHPIHPKSWARLQPSPQSSPPHPASTRPTPRTPGRTSHTPPSFPVGRRGDSACSPRRRGYPRSRSIAEAGLSVPAPERN